MTMDNVIIRPDLIIPVNEINLSAIRAQGAGGQHVNKTSTAIHLRFDIGASSLPEDIKQQLLQCADHRINGAGQFIIKVQQSRSQIKNKELALWQLKQFILEALKVDPERKPTKPTKSAKTKRITAKKQRGETKQLRRKITE